MVFEHPFFTYLAGVKVWVQRWNGYLHFACSWRW